MFLQLLRDNAIIREFARRLQDTVMGSAAARTARRSRPKRSGRGITNLRPGHSGTPSPATDVHKHLIALHAACLDSPQHRDPGIRHASQPLDTLHQRTVLHANQTAAATRDACRRRCDVLYNAVGVRVILVRRICGVRPVRGFFLRRDRPARDASR
jgi:hypothetical protein